MSTKKLAIDLTEGSVISVMTRFAYPILLANLMSLAYNLVDMAIVGQCLGANALSAVSIGADIMLLINLISNGFCMGAQVMIAQYTGARDSKRLNKSIGNIITAFILTALVLTAIFIPCAKPILRFMNTPNEAWEEAVAYTVTCYAGILPIMGEGALGAILRGKGDSKRPLIFMAISSVVNIVLDIAFVSVLGMGAFGAAFATVIAQLVGFIWSWVYLYRRRTLFGFNFTFESFIPQKEIMLQFFKVTIPISLQSILMQCATIFTNKYIYGYGVVAAAINGVGNKLSSIAMVVTNSLNRGGASMVGQNIAAGKIDRVKTVFYFNTVVAFGFVTILSAISIIFREQVFGIFVTDLEVMELSITFMPILILKYFCFAGRAPALSLINGIGRPRLNLLIGLLDGLVFRIGLSLLLGVGFGMGLLGFWYGIALGGFVAFIVGVSYFISGKWKTAKLTARRKPSVEEDESGNESVAEG